jgi:curved DNA-binding protein CbpA
MSPRPALPADDLYARLELPSDATPEAIEIAWRSLLRRHHPDVAGPAGLDQSKRINVAHDWLSVPELRARYDRERGIARGQRSRAAQTQHTAPPPPRQARPVRRPEDVIAEFLDRVEHLTDDELDRLAVADPAPIAFGATIRRFLPEQRQAALSAVEHEIDRRLPPASASRPAIRDSVRAYAAELVLGSFLDELLSEPFRGRTRERLSRGWEAAVGQPRYGPNGNAIRTLLGRLRGLDDAGLRDLARASAATAPDEPWPSGTSPDDDEGLRVSSELATMDAEAAVPAIGADRLTTERARRSAGRLAHLLVLRHAFPPAAFEALTEPWRGNLMPRDPSGPRVHRPRGC